MFVSFRMFYINIMMMKIEKKYIIIYVEIIKNSKLKTNMFIEIGKRLKRLLKYRISFTF